MSPKHREPLPLDPPVDWSYITEWLYLLGGGSVRPASEQLLRRISDRLKGMADPMRLRILHTLQDGEKCVNEILTEVGGSQANVSKHLGVLKRTGLVECRREGVSIYYRIEDPAVFAICRTVCDSLERHVSNEMQEIEAGRAEMMVGSS
jgi:DNA-binding transcriptional ArsR family regulator